MKKRLIKAIIKYKKNITKKTKIYLAYLKIKFLNEIQYKIAALAGIITQFAWGGMYIMLYTAFLKNGNANDYSVVQLSTYIWLHQAFFMLYNTWSVDRDILEQCQTGSIAMELVKPIDLYSIWHAKTIGRKVALTLLRAIPILSICSMPFLGEYSISSPQNIQVFLLFIVTLILAALVLMAYLMFLYVCAMKLISSKGIKLAFQIVLEALSGAVVPIAFMPDIVIKVIKLTPFYYMQNIPFNIYNGYITNSYEILKIILLQILWIIVLSVIGRIIMRKQLRNIIVQGG